MKILEATVTSKGQVTLPKELRDELRIGTGDKVRFTLSSPHQVSFQKQSEPGGSAGMLKHLAGRRPLNAKKMDEAIAEAVASKYRRNLSRRP